MQRRYTGPFPFIHFRTEFLITEPLIAYEMGTHRRILSKTRTNRQTRCVAVPDMAGDYHGLWGWKQVENITAKGIILQEQAGYNVNGMEAALLVFLNRLK